MLTLYRQENSPAADSIEAEFHDLILGYDRVIMDLGAAHEQFGLEHSLPIITNNDRVVSGTEIPAYIVELTQLMRDWQAYQGDSCYVDEDGRVCFY
jgi:hypothetical protein